MGLFYLRIEAVNLDNSIFDTYDISTIRGGSFMLLNAIDNLEGKFGLINIGSAASVGWFKFEAENENAAELTRKKAMDKLEEETGEFATFVSSIIPAGMPDQFNYLMHQLTALCRRQQYQKPTFAWPSLDQSSKNAECELDGVRPAAHTIMKGLNELKVSRAVYIRREEGRRLRKTIYEKICNIDGLEFTDDLEELSKNTGGGALEGKIAFFHIDGNRFGRIRDAVCLTESDLLEFQKYVQYEVRRKALSAILQKAKKDNAIQNKKGQIRLETLMWGGDEIELIVPASCAMTVMETFFDATANVRFRNITLTHTLGVVFCHHNLPILQIRQYAKQLCELAKNGLPKNINDLNDKANCFTFLNMNTYDQVTRKVIDFFNTYYTPANPEDFIISATDIPSLRININILKQVLPKNKLNEIVFEIKNGANEKQLNDIIEKALKLIGPNGKRAKAAIKSIVGEHSFRWYWVNDLWDYIGAESHASTV